MMMTYLIGGYTPSKGGGVKDKRKPISTFLQLQPPGHLTRGTSQNKRHPQSRQV